MAARALKAEVGFLRYMPDPCVVFLWGRWRGQSNSARGKAALTLIAIPIHRNPSPMSLAVRSG